MADAVMKILRVGAEAADENALVLPWGDDTNPRHDPLILTKEIGPSAQCALLMIREALLTQPDFLSRAAGEGVVSVIVPPDADWGDPIASAWKLVVNAAASARMAAKDDPVARAARRRLARARAALDGDDVVGEGPLYIITLAKPDLSRMAVALRSGDFRTAVRDRRPVHGISHQPDALLSGDLLLAEEQRLNIQPPDAGVLALLATMVGAEDGWPAGDPPAVPEGLSRVAGTLTPFLLDLARGADQTPATYLARLHDLVVRRSLLAPPTKDRSAVTLDDLPGLGEAGEWGRRAAADLKAYAAGTLAWSELDRGVVLEGPPGTGKSTFARALATTAGVAFIPASLARWQGSKDGHLGHLLAAMQGTFEEARKKAPCILLIDEIDSFPARASVTHRHRDYVVEVVNALLEQLDGAIERTGVLVVATCNDASNLDPAVTRAGRLERVIRLHRPDAEGLEGILRVHLNGALADADLRGVARVAHDRGAVGADIERFCREARRRARAASRPMVLDDLVAVIGAPPPKHGPEALYRMAVHEAGHVAAYLEIGATVVQMVALDDRVLGMSFTEIDLAEMVKATPGSTRASVIAWMRAGLAGRAAEEAILGEASGGAGGSNFSDLAKATRLACRLVGASGLDDHPEGLLYLGPADNEADVNFLLLRSEFRERVAAVVREAYEAALVLVRENREGIVRVAAALMTRGSLTAEEAGSLLRGDAPGGEP